MSPVNVGSLVMIEHLRKMCFHFLLQQEGQAQRRT